MDTQELEQLYANSLLKKLEHKTYKNNEFVNIANIIGNDFIDIVNRKFGLKNFTMSQTKTMNILKFTIMSENENKAIVILSTKQLNTDEIEILDVLTTLFVEK